MHELKGQLTVRGLVIGCIGCAIITAASVYTALKMGALPWPIVFAAIVSLFTLKAVSRGKATLNEANVTHTIMSAGAMVAGGLAFTIPGAWMLGYADQTSPLEIAGVALAGVLLGLVCTALLRRHFMEDAHLEFPIGQSAALTLEAGNKGGRMGAKLFGSMGLAGIYCVLRDALGVIPAMLFGNAAIPGVTFGIFNSPMMVAVGFLVGTGGVIAWFIGALFGNFGIITGGSSLGLWDIATGQGITASLGMGLMMGCGVAVIVKDIIPKGVRLLRGNRAESAGENGAGIRAGESAKPSPAKTDANVSADETAEAVKSRRKISAGTMGVCVAAAALLLCFAVGLSPLVSIVVVLLTFITCAMSAQSVGQTGIDPMEIFGLIVLLAVAAFSAESQVKLFFVAAVIAVACGLAGDVMNDFKAGHILGTSPRAQLIGQAVGSLLGAGVAVAVICALLAAWGPDAFGLDKMFVSAQASVVATMVSGIPCVPAFVIGLAVGFALYFAKLPAMMIGLGVYLPFYLSLTAFVGCVIRIVVEQVNKVRNRSLSGDELAAREENQQETGLIVASGLLGGESVIGVVLALITVFAGMQM